MEKINEKDKLNHMIDKFCDQKMKESSTVIIAQLKKVI